MKTTLRAVLWRVINIVARRRRDDDLDEEIHDHLDRLTADGVARGLSLEEARLEARREFGGVAAMKESYRDQRGLPWLDALMQDMRYAVRMMRRSPGFTLVAVMTLALGIGATTAVFSVADAALFRPLPYRNGDQLTEVANVMESMGPLMMQGLPRQKLEAWRQQPQVFQRVETYDNDIRQMAGEDDPILITAFSAGMLDMLGVSPTLGRGFDASDIATDASVALISSTLWRVRFAGSPSAVGQTIALDHRLYTIIGVMPPTFRYPMKEVTVWVPLTSASLNLPMSNTLARIRDGLTIEKAREESDRIAESLQRDHPIDEGWKVGLISLAERRTSPKTQSAMVALVGGVGFILLIACANVANLLLSRATSRRHEFAMRAALGASRARLFRQLLVEGFVMAAVAGAAVALASVWSIDAFGRALPATLGIQAFDVAFNGRILAFSLGASLITGLLCAVLPALRAMKPDVNADLGYQQSTAGLSRDHRHVHDLLIAIEVGLTCVLLIGAALLATSLLHMLRVDLGFDPRNLATMRVRLPDRYKARASQDQAFDAVRARLQAIPGVTAVTLATGVPPTDGGGITVTSPGGKDGDIRSQNTLVDANYFNMLGIPVVEGRVFDQTDSPSSPPAIIIDRQLAKRLWPGASGIGRRVKTSRSPTPMTVVGVVGHVKGAQFTNDVDRFQYQAYMSMSQQSASPGRMFALRAGRDVASLLPAMRSAVHSVDPDLLVSNLATTASSYNAVAETPRFFAAVMSAFATVALSLSCVGLYGVLSYSVARRVHEIGVRLALGANRSAVARLIVVEAFLPTTIGLLAGLIGAQWLTTLLTAQLYGVSAHDPMVSVAVVAAIIMTAVAAASIPAYRASQLDPMVALRCE